MSSDAEKIADVVAGLFHGGSEVAAPLHGFMLELSSAMATISGVYGPGSARLTQARQAQQDFEAGIVHFNQLLRDLKDDEVLLRGLGQHGGPDG